MKVFAEWKTALLILKTTEMSANVSPNVFVMIISHLVMLYCQRIPFFPQSCNTDSSFPLFFSALYYSHFIKHVQSLRIVNHPTTDLAVESTQ